MINHTISLIICGLVTVGIIALFYRPKDRTNNQSREDVEPYFNNHEERESKTLDDDFLAESKAASQEPFKPRLHPSEDSTVVNMPNVASANTHAVSQSSTSSQNIWVAFIQPKDGRKFLGYDFLQALAQNDVHFTDNNTFARYETAEGAGQVWFHVASIENPGTFNMDEPGKIVCAGIALILQIKGLSKPSQACSQFVKSIKQLVSDLDAELFDENRQPMTEKMLNHQYHNMLQTIVQEGRTCSENELEPA